LDPAIADSVNIALKDGTGETIYSQVYLSRSNTFNLSSRETGGLLLDITCPGFNPAQAAILTIGSTSDTVEVQLSPVSKRHEESRITFHDSTTLVAKFALLHMNSRYRLTVRYANERNRFLETGGDLESFKVDWTDDAKWTTNALQQEKEPILHQELIMQYLEMYVLSPQGTSKDSIKKWIPEIPPESPAWCFHSNLYTLAFSYHLNDWSSYVNEMIARNPGRNFRAMLLADRARLALAYRDTTTFMQTLAVLTSDFSGTKWATETYRLIHPILRTGDTVPLFNLRSLDDTLAYISSTKMLGKVYLIDFWGTWCGPCMGEMPYLHKAYERFKGKGFTIVSIALDEVAYVERFRKNKWHMPWLNACVGNDRQNATILAFGVPHYPFPILVDSKGVIVALEDELRGDRLEQTLEKYVDPMQWQREELLIRHLNDFCNQTRQQGKESALLRFLPVERQDHIRQLILNGEFDQATALMEESQTQISNFVDAKIRVMDIEFSFSAPDAKEVFLAGSFNGWNPAVDTLTKQGNGIWTITKTLSTGIHCYKFVADGKWFTDPLNTKKYYNGHGDENSVVVVSIRAN
jgi:thiol-disulfide isomerase/thioredoxin